MEGSRLPRVVVGTAALATAALIASAAVPAGSRDTSTNAARNAGISFICPNAICIMKPDGSGRSVFVATWFDSYGDPSWTRDGRALAYFVGYSDTHKIHVFQVSTRSHDEFPRRGAARSF